MNRKPRRTRIRVLSAMLTFVALAAGCASKPDKIGAAYVSPLEFQDYDCGQIGAEMQQVSRRTVDLHQSLKKKADNDAAQMGIGLILFWPALFLLEGGDGTEATEYSTLKGKYNALHDNAVSRKCVMAALPPSPEEQIKALADAEKAEKKEALDPSSIH